MIISRQPIFSFMQKCSAPIPPKALGNNRVSPDNTILPISTRNKTCALYLWKRNDYNKLAWCWQQKRSTFKLTPKFCFLALTGVKMAAGTGAVVSGLRSALDTLLRQLEPLSCNACSLKCGVRVEDGAWDLHHSPFVHLQSHGKPGWMREWVHLTDQQAKMAQQ